MTPEVGKSIGRRYRIIEIIGRGGLGTVYKALDTRLQRIVALKVLQTPLDAESKQRFPREAEALAGLNHPNIVQMYDLGEAEGLLYLAFEYVEGRSLQQIMAEPKPLERDYAIEIIRQVGAALEYAHQRGVIHRDVKPSNILISNEGRVLLLDFGLAIAPGVVTRSQTGTVAGTPAYMSPEQVMGKAVDARSDIFSLGIVLYELLTGTRPFTGGSILEIFRKLAEEAPVPPRRLNPSVPAPIEELVLRSLAKDPDRRFQTGNEFVRALNEARPRPQPRGNRTVVVGSELSEALGEPSTVDRRGGDLDSLLAQIVEAGRLAGADEGGSDQVRQFIRASQLRLTSPKEWAEARRRQELALQEIPAEQVAVREQLESLLREFDLLERQSAVHDITLSVSASAPPPVEKEAVPPSAPLALERGPRLRWLAAFLAVLLLVGFLWFTSVSSRPPAAQVVKSSRSTKPSVARELADWFGQHGVGLLGALGAALVFWFLWRAYGSRARRLTVVRLGGTSQTRQTSLEQIITGMELIPYSPAIPTSTPYPSAIAWLLVLDGLGHSREFRLADNVTIGRQSDNDLVLLDSRISRHHARITLENGRFYISDLGSRHGTFVNGVRVQKHELRDRDEVGIGLSDSQLLFIQAVSPADLTVEAKRRLGEFDAIWEQLTSAARYD